MLTHQLNGCLISVFSKIRHTKFYIPLIFKTNKNWWKTFSPKKRKFIMKKGKHSNNNKDNKNNTGWLAEWIPSIWLFMLNTYCWNGNNGSSRRREAGAAMRLTSNEDWWWKKYFSIIKNLEIKWCFVLLTSFLISAASM